MNSFVYISKQMLFILIKFFVVVMVINAYVHLHRKLTIDDQIS